MSEESTLHAPDQYLSPTQVKNFIFVWSWFLIDFAVFFLKSLIDFINLALKVLQERKKSIILVIEEVTWGVLCLGLNVLDQFKDQSFDYLSQQGYIIFFLMSKSEMEWLEWKRL